MGRIDELIGKSVYLDTNIFVYFLEGMSPFNEAMKKIFQSIENSDIHAVTSELSLAEVLVKPFSDKNDFLIRKYEELFVSKASFEVLPIKRNVLIEAAKVRFKNGCKLPDAIHIATALAEKCSYFLTNDKRFGKTSGIQTLLLSEIAK